ncbi:acyl-CoA dehydrogenase [Amycolatopsis sp. WAC 04182]|uniref:acyl-CoA dehydrogenase family protein n=1 Tax=Amycolatopsis sp. WAC 04182 TaxID=2203198 RepID=UPI000F77A2F5|nr:acyl-CoA dehydrogenase family protein [Amycolatopsis sp. WAC 04182]RSN66218.1 acyl-CoA dehydrogenase [Amycolatopsis sp. WAC 04182]
MSNTENPTREQLVQRATDLVPTLRKHAAWTEENRRLHDESIEAITEAGLFRLRVPKRYGGYEADTRTLVEVAAELGRADASPAWTTAVSWITSWMTGLFPDAVQDEVFSRPDIRVCGTLSPTAIAGPAEGGIVVNGKWGFISGARHAHWQVVIAVLVEEGAEPYPVMGVVPMTDLLIVDDWTTSGLRGTGSVSTVAKDLFIPSERIISLPAVLQGQYSSTANAGLEIFRAPLLPVAAASSVGSVLGLGRAAKEQFLKRLPNRKITYTAYESQREAPLTHHQVADATLKLDQAEFHATRLTSLVDGKAADGTPWKLEERVQARADMGATVKLSKEAIDIFANASGGSSIFSDVPIQRIVRDIQAVNLHALMHPDTNNELYGRVLCGLEPNTLYI